MNIHKTRTQKLALTSILVSVGLILQIVENALPLTSPLAGVKLGIANVTTIVALYALGGSYALAISIVRSLVGGLMYGSGTMVIYSVCGAVVSSASMLVAFRAGKTFSTAGVGIVGALAHNLAQIAVAAVFLKSAYVFTYLPLLMLTSIPTGFFTGFCARMVLHINFIGIEVKNRHTSTKE